MTVIICELLIAQSITHCQSVMLAYFEIHVVEHFRCFWVTFASIFYVQKQLLLLALLSHRNSVCLSVTRVDQSKMVQARITKSSPSAAWKTQVSGTIKLFHKFIRDHLERGC